jgi:hypothetical protein
MNSTDWQGHNKTEYEYIDIDFGSCAVYMDHKAVMWTAPADQQQLLEAGHHQFPFTFHIPVNCPPSFEGILYMNSNHLLWPSSFDNPLPQVNTGTFATAARSS